MPEATLPGETATGNRMDRNELIARIGRLLVADPAVSDGLWDGYALIVRYGDGAVARRISGFRYGDGAGHEAATPRDPAIGEAFDALRQATLVPGKAPWDACVLRIRRDTGKIGVDFEYDAPEQWDIGPETLAAVAERARPA